MGLQRPLPVADRGRHRLSTSCVKNLLQFPSGTGNCPYRQFPVRHRHRGSPTGPRERVAQMLGLRCHCRLTGVRSGLAGAARTGPPRNQGTVLERNRDPRATSQGSGISFPLTSFPRLGVPYPSSCSDRYRKAGWIPAVKTAILARQHQALARMGSSQARRAGLHAHEAEGVTSQSQVCQIARSRSRTIRLIRSRNARVGAMTPAEASASFASGRDGGRVVPSPIE